MQTYDAMTWKELQNEFECQLEKSNDHFTSVQNSANELKKIYNHVMKKSQDDSYALRNEFASSWLNKIDVSDNDSLLAIKDEYNTFLNGPKPSTSDFKNFEASLEQKLYQKSLFS